MIAGLHGQLVAVNGHEVIVNCQGVHYEVLVPLSVAQRLLKIKDADDKVMLITYHYLQVSPSSASPVLVGFLNTVERDFFLEFIKVSGVGPRAAVKALNKAIGEIAQAIDRGDTKYLTTLPGVGPQRAKEIVAKLQGKMGKFTLMQDAVSNVNAVPVMDDVKQEALMVLEQLQYKRQEALGMIEEALKRNASINSSEALLNEIYNQRKSLRG